MESSSFLFNLNDTTDFLLSKTFLGLDGKHSVLITDVYLAYFTAINAQNQLQILPITATIDRTAAFSVFTFAAGKYLSLRNVTKTEKLWDETSSNPTFFNETDLAYLTAVNLHEYSLTVQKESTNQSEKLEAIKNDEEAALKYLRLITPVERPMGKIYFPSIISAAPTTEVQTEVIPMARRITIPSTTSTTTIPTTTPIPTTIPTTTPIPSTTTRPTTTPHVMPYDYEDMNIQGQSVN